MKLKNIFPKKAFTSIAQSLSIALIFTTTVAMANLSNLSAKRLPNQDYKSIIQKHILSITNTVGSAYSNRTQLTNLNLQQVPNFASYKQIEDLFFTVRDMRFLKDSANAKSPRRLTWLYPDDGCYARATMVNHIIESDNLSQLTPFKVFIFGNLSVATDNAPDGRVGWWYHVVPIVRVDQTAYVIDPAIDAKKPLTLNDWVLKMTNSEANVELAVCDSKAHGPYSYCFGDDDQFESALDNLEFGFLSDERSRLIELNRNAEEELGDNPPWLKP